MIEFKTLHYSWLHASHKHRLIYFELNIGSLNRLIHFLVAATLLQIYVVHFLTLISSVRASSPNIFAALSARKAFP
jgi:hypothetical protein